MREASKKQTASIGGDFCVWGWNGKIFQYKIGMIRLKLLNSCIFPLWKNFDRKRSQQQLASTNYHHNQILVENVTEISLQSEFSHQCSPKLKEFSLMREAIFNHNSSPDSFHDPTMLAVQSGLRSGVEFTSKCGDEYQIAAAIDYKNHLIDEENIATCVHSDSGAAFYSEHGNWNQKFISRLCGNSKGTPNNRQRNCYLDGNGTSNISLDPYIFETWIRMSLQINQPHGIWDLENLQKPYTSNL